MAKKYYVVWAGRTPGIFSDWASCKRSVDKFPGARYKSFPTKAEAETAFANGTQKQTSKAQTSGATNQQATPKSTAPNSDLVIYCDGGCDPNPGQAGSGCAVYKAGKLSELWYGLYNPQGTNNTAELNALHQSLLIAEKAVQQQLSVSILCDSMYAINCISVWAYSWKQRGWKKASGEIKNLELIQSIHTLYDGIKHQISLEHVKAHIGIEGNELADRMTMLAVDKQEPLFIRYAETININALLGLRAG